MGDKRKLESAMERIRRLECPVADIGERVAGILAEYGVSNTNAVVVDKQEDLQANGVQLFRATVKPSGETIVFKVITGSDDYVAKVIDVSDIN